MERAGSIYHFTQILSRNGFASLEGIMSIIDFSRTYTKVQLYN